MPVIYQCEMCETTAESSDGWQVVSVSVLHVDASVSLGGRTLDMTYPDLWFDTKQHRDEWLETAGLPKGPQ